MARDWGKGRLFSPQGKSSPVVIMPESEIHPFPSIFSSLHAFIQLTLSEYPLIQQILRAAVPRPRAGLEPTPSHGRWSH